MICWTPIWGKYLSNSSILEKCGKKQLFFLAAMAGLGKYCMGGYGRIGIYRVKKTHDNISFSYPGRHVTTMGTVEEEETKDGVRLTPMTESSSEISISEEGEFYT